MTTPSNTASTPTQGATGSGGTGASTPSMIRNIQQSVQNRDVIKQAPDIIVYIDGQNYLVNPFIGKFSTFGTPLGGTTVPFNDFVQSWQSSYDTESMIPSGSLTLSVPVQLEYLFRVPGGNSILRTMSEIRVFAKGFYFSQNGNTVYRQIFKGFISAITYVPNGSMLTITLNCFGALGLLEKMQIDMQPSAISMLPISALPTTGSSWNMDAYANILMVFLYASMIDGFSMASLQQAAMTKENPYYQAVTSQYVAKWQALLYDLARDVHVFGYWSVQDVLAKIAENLNPVDSSNSPMKYQAMGVAYDKVGPKKESTQVADQQPFFQKLRDFMPEMGIAAINLINGRVTSRLERLRYITNLIGFEAYQDVDGGIVVKPPLYNLDVLNLGTDGVSGIDPSLRWLSEAQNPFVVQLSEILTETETEDEAGVRLTRVIARGSYTSAMQINGNKELLSVAEDIDLAKLYQFGLRTEPPHEAPWLQEGDAKALYAYAANELARMNLGYRHYTVTIPMRPEVKLGFPMYFPHKDIYGYVKTVTMNWVKGQSATTSLTLHGLRRRPMFPQEQTITGKDGSTSSVVMMTQQKNLTLQWSKLSDKGVTPTPTSALSPSAQKLEGQLASLPLPERTVVAQQKQMFEHLQHSGIYFGMNPDDTSNCWRIMADDKHAFDKRRVVDDTYYGDLRKIRPYTDEKGYELTGPFPWGRWQSLKECLTMFTISGDFGQQTTAVANPALKPVSAETELLTNASAFLFAADSNATAQETASELVSTLVPQTVNVNNYKSFELAYTADPTQNAGPVSTLKASVPTLACSQDSDNALAAKSFTMLTGQTTEPSLTQSILSSIPKSDMNLSEGPQ